jgi:dethiobiotin synthetase
MKKGVFITGTGTDVGKTFISALLVKQLRDSGIDAGYYKPALSGAERHGGELMPGDALYVRNAAGLNEGPNELVSYVFEAPVSPHLASRIERRPIEIDRIKRDFTAACKRHVFTVVEGCGGLVCPLNMSGEAPLMLTDVIKMTGLDCILVSDAGLGAIHASVTTAAYAMACGIAVTGIILNRFKPGNRLCEDNKDQIERLAGLPVIGYAEDNADKVVFGGNITSGIYI